MKTRHKLARALAALALAGSVIARSVPNAWAFDTAGQTITDASAAVTAVEACVVLAPGCAAFATAAGATAAGYYLAQAFDASFVSTQICGTGAPDYNSATFVHTCPIDMWWYGVSDGGGAAYEAGGGTDPFATLRAWFDIARTQTTTIQAICAWTDGAIAGNVNGLLAAFRNNVEDAGAAEWEQDCQPLMPQITAAGQQAAGTAPTSPAQPGSVPASGLTSGYLASVLATTPTGVWRLDDCGTHAHGSPGSSFNNYVSGGTYLTTNGGGISSWTSPCPNWDNPQANPVNGNGLYGEPIGGAPFTSNNGFSALVWARPVNDGGTVGLISGGSGFTKYFAQAGPCSASYCTSGTESVVVEIGTGSDLVGYIFYGLPAWSTHETSTKKAFSIAVTEDPAHGVTAFIDGQAVSGAWKVSTDQCSDSYFEGNCIIASGTGSTATSGAITSQSAGNLNAFVNSSLSNVVGDLAVWHTPQASTTILNLEAVGLTSTSGLSCPSGYSLAYIYNPPRCEPGIGAATPTSPGTQTTPTPSPTSGGGAADNNTLQQVGHWITDAVDGAANAISSWGSQTVNWLQDVAQKIGSLWNDLLTWLQSAYNSAIGLIEQFYNMVFGLMGRGLAELGGVLRVAVQNFPNWATVITNPIVAAVTAVTTAIAGLATAIATAIVNALQTAFVPSTTAIQSDVTSVQTQASNTFPFSVVGSLVTGGQALTGAVTTGMSASPCGPALGFSGIHPFAGPDMPGFHVALPSPSPCPGNGPGGSRTQQDDDVSTLWGYQSLIRGLMTFGVVWLCFMNVVGGAAPWAKTSREVAPA